MSIKIKSVGLNGALQLSDISSLRSAVLPASVVLRLKMIQGQQLSKVDKHSP